jgi:predicted SprT family Zn-dependent metalloprotease
MVKKTELKEQVVQKFSYRCPYCDQPVSYDEFDLRVGENEIQCLHCKKTYIKMVAAPFPGGRHKFRSGKAGTLR